jgi:hypothetical protein
MATKTIRVVSREVDGSLRVKDHGSLETLKTCYEQVGIDDCSTDLTLRGFPLFRGLVGPMAEGKRIARYETPEVFEALTKEWAAQRVRRRNRSEIMAAEAAETADAASGSEAATVHPQQRAPKRMHFPVINLPGLPVAPEYVG